MIKIRLKSDEFEGNKNPRKKLMTFLEFMLELMMIVDVPDWGCCP